MSLSSVRKASRGKTPTDDNVSNADSAVDAAGAHADDDAAVSVDATTNAASRTCMLMLQLLQLM